MNLGRAMRWVAVVVVVLLLAMAWRAMEQPSALRELADTKAPIGRIEPSEPNDEGRPSAAIAHAHEQSERRAQARVLERGRRDALRERILERERTRAAIAEDPSPGGADDDAGDAPAPGPGLTDRIGGRDALMAALNQELMPLADECIEQAGERNPELRGMLALELELVADAELGAVIDAAGYPATNEVHDPELLDCIRETALSTSLPPPPEGGREAFMLTMPIGGSAGAGAEG
jgi:hypothetical protein